jgi:hypothetical protein
MLFTPLLIRSQLALKATLWIMSLPNTSPVCQLSKKERKKCGLLPPKQAEADPWVTVCMDLIGPFSIKNKSKTHTLRALTTIDPATGWFEIVQATNKSATTIQICFIIPG